MAERSIGHAVVLLVFTLTTPLSAADPKEAARKELDQLQGSWEISSWLDDGAEDENLLRLGFKLVFKGQVLTVSGANPDFPTLTFDLKLDASATPKLLDFTLTTKDNENVGQILEGVYERDGDTLKWCYVSDGGRPAKGNRPTAVESKAGTGQVMVTLKRLKE